MYDDLDLAIKKDENQKNKTSFYVFGNIVKFNKFSKLKFGSYKF
jgi:hypothetical protein